MKFRALNGSREGLFMVAMAAHQILARAPARSFMPNCFIPLTRRARGGCEAASARHAANGFLPDLTRSRRHSRAHDCVLSCFTGQSAGRGREPRLLQRLHALALKYDFMIFGDECYSKSTQ
jgi:hypothetical protein